MTYVFWNIFWCLLAAAALGGGVGWFLKTLFGDSATADLDASWQSRYGTLENERDRLAASLRESDGQVTTLRTRHSALETDFTKAAADLDAISGKMMIQEESLTEWSDKARAWTGERAKLAADLEGWKRKGTDAAAKLAKLESDCGARVTDLELKLNTAEAARDQRIAELQAQLAAAGKQRTELESGWTIRYSALESDRNSFQAQLGDLSGRTAAADAATAARIADLESQLAKAIGADRIADLNARIEAMIDRDKANDAAYEKQISGFKAQLSKSQTELAKAVATDREDDAAYEHRIADLNARIAAMIDRDKANDAAYEKQIADVKAQLSKSQTELAKAVATDREDDASYEKRIADLNARIEKMIDHDKANDAAYEKQIAGFKAQLSKSQTELVKAAATDREQDAAYEHRIADLTERIEKMIAHDKANDAAYEKQIAGFKAQLSKSQTELAKAVSADREDDASSEKRIAALETQLTASRAELAQLKAAEGKKTVTGDIERIEGIGPAYGQKLRSIGIGWVRELLDQGGDPKGRQRIAAETGIKAELILAWVNAADLLRVDGVTPDWAELLEASGVDTVKELKNRGPVNLLAKLTEANPTGARGRIAPTLPELEEVEGWVAQAKAMRPRVSH